MMGMMGGKMGDMMGAGMSGMMAGGKMGMMGHGMEHMFFLDRSEQLGLSAEQVNKLKAIHVECRKDNIRNAAEAKIARLDLADLLSGDNWALKDAEPQARKVQKLEGDIQVRHLEAVSEARKVLTAEQLKQAHTDDSSGDLENLFQ
jgi:Spy/CpxP family protein refolding chaperone